MSSPVNLNKVRKERARAEKRARADANSIKFGLSKTEKMKVKRENSRIAKQLEGKAVETSVEGTKDTLK